VDTGDVEHTVTGRTGGNGPGHAARPSTAPGQVFAAAVGVAALLAALGAGAAACLNTLEPARSTPTSASQITVTPGIGAPPLAP